MDKLKEYEPILKQAQQGFIKSAPRELLDIAFPIYKETYKNEVLSHNCSSCVFKVLNFVAHKYFLDLKRIEMERILNNGAEREASGRESTDTARTPAKTKAKSKRN